MAKIEFLFKMPDLKLIPKIYQGKILVKEFLILLF